MCWESRSTAVIYEKCFVLKYVFKNYLWKRRTNVSGLVTYAGFFYFGLNLSAFAHGNLDLSSSVPSVTHLGNISGLLHISLRTRVAVSHFPTWTAARRLLQKNTLILRNLALRLFQGGGYFPGSLLLEETSVPQILIWFYIPSEKTASF